MSPQPNSTPQSELTRNDEYFVLFLPHRPLDTFTPTPGTPPGLYWAFIPSSAQIMCIRRVSIHSRAGLALEEIRKMTEEQVGDLTAELVQLEESLEGITARVERVSGDDPTTVEGATAQVEQASCDDHTAIQGDIRVTIEPNEGSHDAYFDIDRAGEPQTYRGHRHESNRQCTLTNPMRSPLSAYHRMRRSILTVTPLLRRHTEPALSETDFIELIAALSAEDMRGAEDITVVLEDIIGANKEDIAKVKARYDT